LHTQSATLNLAILALGISVVIVTAYFMRI
jgi:hypothetical protein